MKPEELITAALKKAKERGIKIVKGAVFNWVDPADIYAIKDLPYSCNATGAVLLELGLEKLAPPIAPWFVPGWKKNVEDYLGETDLWLWRFNKGFDGGYALDFMVVDEKGKDKIKKDTVSRLGIKITKEFVED
jgi:hypothetical protein